ncbi:hypothetical protein V6N12_074880 [Hibiscus sabdariffa]|uniref:Uncharacterized protein n=1 Tax=Hibiscus sabdariffa TaxID=183260 RepID=A0ABR2D2P4_9ROSI
MSEVTSRTQYVNAPVPAMSHTEVGEAGLDVSTTPEPGRSSGSSGHGEPIVGQGTFNGGSVEEGVQGIGQRDQEIGAPNTGVENSVSNGQTQELVVPGERDDTTSSSAHDNVMTAGSNDALDNVTSVAGSRNGHHMITRSKVISGW